MKVVPVKVIPDILGAATRLDTSRNVTVPFPETKLLFPVVVPLPLQALKVSASTRESAANAFR